MLPHQSCKVSPAHSPIDPHTPTVRMYSIPMTFDLGSHPQPLGIAPDTRPTAPVSSACRLIPRHSQETAEAMPEGIGRPDHPSPSWEEQRSPGLAPSRRGPSYTYHPQTNNAPQSEAADLKKWSRKNMLKLDKIHASIHCRAESFPLVPQLSPHTMHNT